MSLSPVVRVWVWLPRRKQELRHAPTEKRSPRPWTLSQARQMAIGCPRRTRRGEFCQLCDPRSSEVTEREVRDLDDGGRQLWIPDSKTAAGRRRLEVPEVLQPHLRGLAEAKLPNAPLFGHHWRDWPRKQVKRICALAKVPVVCAHSMRGLHSTLAIEAGTTAHVVASSLGHESPTVTFRSYVAPGTAQRASTKRILTVLKGGQS